MRGEFLIDAQWNFFFRPQVDIKLKVTEACVPLSFIAVILWLCLSWNFPSAFVEMED